MENSYLLGEGEESFLLAYIGLIGSILYFLWLRRDKTRYRNIPALGFSGTFTSIISAFRWFRDPGELVRKGYAKFPNGIFRYPTLTGWIVVLAKPKFVEEMRKAPEDEVSASEAMSEVLGLPYTINSGLLADQELKSLLGAQLTRNLQEFLPDLHTLVSSHVNELITQEDNDWKYVDEADLMTRMCCRAVNHIVAGASLSKDAQFLDDAVVLAKNLRRYGRNVMKLPGFLRVFYVIFFTPLPRIKRRLRTLLSNIMRERHDDAEKPGNAPPNDLVSWFLDHEGETEMTVDELDAHVLLVNHLALQPLIQVMTQALRNLAIYPEEAKSLHAEVEDITKRSGWTKSSVDKLRLVDAFVKETMRLNASELDPYFPGSIMGRRCRRPLTFSDGTTIPQTALLFVGSQLLHTDARYYPNPDRFDPQRFAPSTNCSSRPTPITPSSSSDSHSSSSSWASASSSTISPVALTLPATSATFLGWGHGKHACPGRFFTAAFMKLLLAYLVAKFEFRLPPIQEGEEANEQKSTDIGSRKILWIELRSRRH